MVKQCKAINFSISTGKGKGILDLWVSHVDQMEIGWLCVFMILWMDKIRFIKCKGLHINYWHLCTLCRSIHRLRYQDSPIDISLWHAIRLNLFIYSTKKKKKKRGLTSGLFIE